MTAKPRVHVVTLREVIVRECVVVGAGSIAEAVEAARGYSESCAAPHPHAVVHDFGDPVSEQYRARWSGRRGDEEDAAAYGDGVCVEVSG